MKLKTRLILSFVRAIARIVGVILKVKKALGFVSKVEGPERVIIYSDGGMILEFMAVAFFKDKIIEQYGIVGQPAPRGQHPVAIRANIQDRIDELLEEGYVDSSQFDKMAPLRVAGGEAAQAEPFVESLSEFLADRGLGLITGVQGNTLDLSVVDTEIATTLISAFVAKGPFAGYSEISCPDASRA